jgi:hypothetical protein
MTIIKKDGNVYKISGPNKLAKNQTIWDSNKLIFHNFNWKDEIFKYKNSPKKVENHKQAEVKSKVEIPDKVENHSQTEVKIEPKVEMPREPEVKIPKIEISEEDVKIEEPKITQDYELPFIKYKTLMHCLPAENKKYVDNFYGENWSKIIYKKKFIFPSVIISNEDLTLEFWSTDPNRKITENSIVFPFAYEVYNEDTNSYDRIPFDEHRWWMVSSIESKEKGWLFTCVPSSNQPDFSD